MQKLKKKIDKYRNLENIEDRHLLKKIKKKKKKIENNHK